MCVCTCLHVCVCVCVGVFSTCAYACVHMCVYMVIVPGSQYHWITSSRHPNIPASLHHIITALQHHKITALHHLMWSHAHNICLRMCAMQRINTYVSAHILGATTYPKADPAYLATRQRHNVSAHILGATNALYLNTDPESNLETRRASCSYFHNHRHRLCHRQ